ncbi:hypothetical protein [Streptomyces sp. 891-h]|uniref:hypothetical protein n=1 Tax=Streptomyces sp. 891-h TaxID=2720714 RepID=UPI001FAAD3F3|nr:hypothetical protein [Streptomyces sp. 891-h]UNZ22313.1 hypothetical protein HC362_34675 [Streptomyces sp. 891-h]
MSARKPSTRRSQAEIRRERQERRRKEAEAVPELAQGRPQPMLTLNDLPTPTDAPDAGGELSTDEAETWELCQQGFTQFHDAWWVFARSVEIALRGKLWRADYSDVREFIEDVTGGRKAVSTVYRQAASAGIAEIIAGHTPIELESNDHSRVRESLAAIMGSSSPADPSPPPAPRSPEPEQSNEQKPSPPKQRAPKEPTLTISQRSALALGPVREVHGDAGAAEVYRAIAEETGKKAVPEKTVLRIMPQLPLSEDIPLDDVLHRARTLAKEPDEAEVSETTAADPVKWLKAYVNLARDFAQGSAGMAEAYTAAAAADEKKALRYAKQIHRHMKDAAKNFPDV